MWKVKLKGKVVYRTHDIWTANLKEEWLIFEGHKPEDIIISN